MNYSKFVLIISLLSLLHCSDGIININNNVTLDLILKKNVLTYSDNLEGDFIVTNNSIFTVTFYFNTKCQFGYKIYNESELFYEYPEGCRQEPSNFSLNPGEFKQFNIYYNLEKSDGSYIPIGMYEIEVYLLDNNYGSIIRTLTIN